MGPTDVCDGWNIRTANSDVDGDQFNSTSVRNVQAVGFFCLRDLLREFH